MKVVLLVGLVVLVTLVVAVVRLDDRVQRLDRACVPMSTGGGVTQCAQPTIRDLALLACVQNVAYTRPLIGQCVNDWENR